MWTFDVIANEFYLYQADLKQDRDVRQRQQQAQAQMKRG